MRVFCALLLAFAVLPTVSFMQVGAASAAEPVSLTSLLDEPTSELDEQATERLIEVLGGLPQAMIVVSHNRPFWQRVAAAAVQLRQGRIEAC